MLFVDQIESLAGDVEEPCSSALGISALLSAFQLLTSSKWSADKISAQDAVKAEYRPAAVADSISVRTADGKIPWSTVRLHDHAGSCWMVVRNKARCDIRCASEQQYRSAMACRSLPDCACTTAHPIDQAHDRRFMT